MIRKLKRSARHAWAEWRLRERRTALAAALADHLGHPVTLRSAGAAGRDSVYAVDAPAGPVGMLRIANPWKRRRALPPEMPFRWLENDAERLDREWHAFQVGAPHGLTPEPLWRCGDALLCARVDAPRLSDRLAEEPARFWELLAMASEALGSLHALGLTHMDACLANVLAPPGPRGCVLIDFEYAPAASLERAEQQAYDHLRLLESSLKFLPPSVRAGHRPWMDALARVVTDEARSARIEPLAPALGRVLGSADLVAELAGLFVALGSRST